MYLLGVADARSLGRANNVDCLPTGCPHTHETQSDVTPAKADLRKRTELHYKLGNLFFFD